MGFGFFCVVPEYPVLTGAFLGECHAVESGEYQRQVALAISRAKYLCRRIKARRHAENCNIPTVVCGKSVPGYLIKEVAFLGTCYSQNALLDLSGPCSDSDKDDAGILPLAEAVFSYFDSVPAVPAIIMVRDESVLCRLMRALMRDQCPDIEWNRDTVILVKFDGIRPVSEYEIVP